jgi:predicted TIM-barrel fold metal-dependent hydrolase
MDEALEQLRVANEHGACGVFRRGFEARPVFDPYYFPVYDLAQQLNLPVCIHTGRGFLPLVRYMPGESFSTNKLPVVSSCQSLIYHGIPPMFPQLRWGFVEAAALWLPYVIKDLRRRLERDGKPLLSQSPLRDNRMYVACQTDDDLPYLISYVGEDNLMIGSDYGHSDIATELQAVRDLGKAGEVSPEVARKIRDDNPRALYGL